MRDGEEVKISKRTGDIVELDDVIDEVGADAARLTFLLQSIDTPQTFDLDVVKSQSMDNPVFYVQMAHARIRSIARVAAERGVERAAARRRRPRRCSCTSASSSSCGRSSELPESVASARQRPGPAPDHDLGARAGRPRSTASTTTAT